jgi:hypothetical protein
MHQPPAASASSAFSRSALQQTAPRQRRRGPPLQLAGLNGTPVTPSTPDLAASPCVPQTLQQVLMQAMAPAERRTVFGLFASLERPLSLADLSAVFTMYQQLLEPFTRTVLGLLGEGVFPVEFELIRYLISPDEVYAVRVSPATPLPQHPSDSSPSADSFLNVPFISWPVHTLLQSWYFLLTARRYGWAPVTELFRSRVGASGSAPTTGGLLGLGKGIFAMLAVSEAAPGGEAALAAAVAKHMRGAYAAGRALYLHHELMRASRVPSAASSSSSLPSSTDSAMPSHSSLLVVNVSSPVLQLLVEAANSESGVCISDLQVSRVLAPRAAVVCGHPADLARLQVLLNSFSVVSGSKIHCDPLPSATPENSHFYNDAVVQEVLRTWLGIGFRVDTTALGLPCCIPCEPPMVIGGPGFSTLLLPCGEAGFMRCLAECVLCCCQSFLPVLEGSVGQVNTYILDFTAARLNVGQLLAWSYPPAESAGQPLTPVAGTVMEQVVGTVVISLPSDKPVSSILPTPKRSGESGVLRSTLQKCAVLNELLVMARTAEHSGEGGIQHSPNIPMTPFFHSADATFSGVGLLVADGSLSSAGDQFTRYLLEATSVAFPPDVLAVCRNVLTLLEMWEALEMTGKRIGTGGKQVIRTVGSPGLFVFSSGRRH